MTLHPYHFVIAAGAWLARDVLTELLYPWLRKHWLKLGE